MVFLQNMCSTEWEYYLICPHKRESFVALVFYFSSSFPELSIIFLMSETFREGYIFREWNFPRRVPFEWMTKQERRVLDEREVEVPGDCSSCTWVWRLHFVLPALGTSSGTQSPCDPDSWQFPYQENTCNNYISVEHLQPFKNWQK